MPAAFTQFGNGLGQIWEWPRLNFGGFDQIVVGATQVRPNVGSVF